VCPYERQERGRHRGEGQVEIEAKIGSREPQECLALPEAGRSREGFSLRAFRGSMALPTP